MIFAGRDNNRRRAAVRRSFTMIEIMIVVIIIGMLAALVGPRIIGSMDKARVKTTAAQLSNLKDAVQRFYMDCSEYPQSLEDLMVKSGSDKWDGPYLDAKNLPRDGWDCEFVYSCPGSDGMAFEIISYGADKTEGGEGYNADISFWN